jgi:hypothetical protein
VNGNAASRVFYIGWYTHFNKTVSLSGLTITNGRVSGDYGGGIYNNRCTLTLNNCTLSGNSADYDGGGIFNDHATLTGKQQHPQRQLERRVGRWHLQ